MVSPPVQESRDKLMSPVTTKEQKPFRGFDISSLIRKDDEEEEEKESRSPVSSPRVSVGPPVEKSSNPYGNIFSSNLYQQYLGQLLSQQQQAFHAAAAPPPPPHLPPFNPMLLQAQLAMAASSNPLLGGYGGLASSIMAERMKAHRYSPYHTPVSHNTSLNTSVSSSLSSPGASSAFVSLTPRSPPVSPPHSATPPVMSPDPHHTSPSHHRYSPASHSPSSSSARLSPPVKSEIKSIENMISGLNGGEESGRFGIAHDSRKFV